MFWKNNDKIFEKIFKDHIQNTILAAEQLEKLFSDLSNSEQYAQKLTEMEHQADNLVAQAHELLDSTFITGLDKPDIAELIDEMDHVIDCIENVANRTKTYHLIKSRTEATAMVKIISQMTNQLEPVFGDISKLKMETVKKQVVAIKNLEEQADKELANGLERLFMEENDTKTLIAWKNILEMLEKTTDRCKNVINIINSITRKEAR